MTKGENNEQKIILCFGRGCETNEKNIEFPKRGS